MRLILTRHCKSDWDDPLLDDFDRPLNARGRDAAARLGRWMAAQGHVPDAVLCSSALRTRETWAGIAAASGASPEVSHLDALYLAGPDTLLRELRKARGGTVLMIAHNPGIGDFAGEIVARRPRHADFSRYPTGATLVCDFEGSDWGAAHWAQGAAADFTVPRDLPG